MSQQCNTSNETPTGWNLEEKCLYVNLPGVNLQFPLESGNLLGLGCVTILGIQQRQDEVLLKPLFRSLKGINFNRFTLEAVETTVDEVHIRTLAHGVREHETPYGDQYSGHVFNAECSTIPVVAEFTWILRSEKVQIGGLEYKGFSYAWRFSSETEAIHRLVCQATWEIGGRAVGNTILSQGQVTPAVYTATLENHFTSACLQSLQRFNDPTAMSFQFVPRWGAQQCFDFLSHKKGTLVGFWPDKHDTRSFLQKNPGEDVIFIIDAMHWKASKTVTTTRKCIVFAPSESDGMPVHIHRNRWYEAYEYCTGNVRNLYGIKKSRPLPERMVGYKQRLNDDGSFEFLVGSDWVPANEWLPAIADKLLPSYKEQGIRRVITEPIVESDPTQRGRLTKLSHSGLHTDLNIGSVCCVHRYRPADFFGGMEAWSYFCNKAHALGLEVGHWIGPHLAYHAPILKQNPDWLLHGFNTIVDAGGYPNYMLACVNWNTPVRQWIFDDLIAMRDAGGLDYVWFDSLANLGMLPIDYSREMQTNTDALMEFIADLQGAGIAHISVEGMSPVAMSGAHIMDHEPNHDGGVQWIAGQNSWLWYEGNEDLLIHQQPRMWVHKSRTLENVRQRLFRCLANACVPELHKYANEPWFADLTDAYLSVEHHLVHRRLLPDQQGVEWSGNGSTLLFAYHESTYNLPVGATATCWQNGDFQAVEHSDVLHTDPYAIYRID